MKKLILAVIALLGFTLTASAQDGAKKHLQKLKKQLKK